MSNNHHVALFVMQLLLLRKCYCGLFRVFCDHMISPCFNKKLVEVLVSVAICTAVLRIAPYLRVFRIQSKASYNWSFEPDRAYEYQERGFI